MIYLFDEAIPINTLPDNPANYEMPVTRGLVYRIEVTFPPGSFGLAGIRIFNGSYQVWPSTPGKWFRGDNVKIGFDEMYLFDEAPFLFQVQAYNRDSVWSHTIFARIGMVSKKQYMARFLPSVSFEYWRQMLEEIEADQNSQVEEQQRQSLETDIFPSEE